MATKSFEEASVKAEEKPYLSFSLAQAIKVKRYLISSSFELENRLKRDIDTNSFYAKYTARELHTARRALAIMRKSSCGPIAIWNYDHEAEPIYWPFEEDLN